MKRFQSILVAVDSRFDEQPALQFATRLATYNKAKLTALEVVPRLSWAARLALPDPDHTQELMSSEKSRALDTLVQPARDLGLDVTTKVLTGKTSIEIMREVLTSNHDLVVRVTKGVRSERTGWFGTTSLRLLRKCPCPLWLVRPDSEPRFDTVLTAIDVTPDDQDHARMNKTVMDLGSSVAQYEGGQHHVAYVWELFGGRTMRESARFLPGEFEEAKHRAEPAVVRTFDAFLADYGLSHESKTAHLIYDEQGPGHGVAQLAQEIKTDLVILGTIARQGVSGALIGNTAEHVLDQVACSVLAIKPDGFVSPMTLRG